MAELLCLEQDVDFQDRPEGEGPMRSYRDPTIFDDASVLENLLRSEERYAINPRYFTCVQTEIAVNMRRTVGQWMLEVRTRRLGSVQHVSRCMVRSTSCYGGVWVPGVCLPSSGCLDLLPQCRDGVGIDTLQRMSAGQNAALTHVHNGTILTH